MEKNVPFLFLIFSTKWNGNGMEKEWKRKGKKHITKLESKFDGLEWKWNGIGLENFREKKSVENFVEMEWKWNEIYYVKTSKKKLIQWNRSVMELKWKISSDKVYMIMYWKWEWNSQK